LERSDSAPGIIEAAEVHDSEMLISTAKERVIHPVRMTESGTWQTATFHTKNAGFGNMQNAGADFRIWAKAPELYLRRVTATRETQTDRL